MSEPPDEHFFKALGGWGAVLSATTGGLAVTVGLTDPRLAPFAALAAGVSIFSGLAAMAAFLEASDETTKALLSQQCAKGPTCPNFVPVSQVKRLNK
ncbi:MAG: hypothetical protein PHW76_09360 [Alphaproteobacteria bacterium]|nr:hypothetical protein [Alphaproteobacteria bacterium]